MNSTSVVGWLITMCEISRTSRAEIDLTAVSAIPVKRENQRVALVHLVSLVHPNKPNKQDKPAEPALSYSLDFSDELMKDLR